MPESTAIDSALLAYLRADAQLAALAPDGVYFDLADPGSQRFILVSVAESVDMPMFRRRAWEDLIYLVKAVMLVSANGNIAGAANRIDALLEDRPWSAAGYTWMSGARVSRVRYPEQDEQNPAITWQHWGGRYRVQMSAL